MSKRRLMFYIVNNTVLIVLQSILVLSSPLVFVRVLSLIALIAVSANVGSLIREWTLVRAKEREGRPVYRLTDDPGEIDLAEGLLRREMYAPYGIEPQPADNDGQECYFIARHGDEVIAAMVMFVDGEHAELRRAAVAGNRRGQGVGLTLWRVVYAYAERERIRTIDVITRNTTYGFWRRCGLEETLDEWMQHDVYAAHNIRHKRMRITVGTAGQSPAGG